MCECITQDSVRIFRSCNACKAEHASWCMPSIQCMVHACPYSSVHTDVKLGLPVSHPAVQQMYETAAPFFELAAQVQPQEVKWHLMVASCFRRTGNQQQVKHWPPPMTLASNLTLFWSWHGSYFQLRLVYYCLVPATCAEAAVKSACDSGHQVALVYNNSSSKQLECRLHHVPTLHMESKRGLLR